MLFETITIIGFLVFILGKGFTINIGEINIGKNKNKTREDS